MTINYFDSARRHLGDGHCLQAAGRLANAGQLFGFSVECGLKAVLVRLGVQTTLDGNIARATGLREHEPKLSNAISTLSTLPDGRAASVLLAHLPSLGAMGDWSVDHRYWDTGSVPVTSLGNWELAALEVDSMLDVAFGMGL
ncbi:hypothetical protein [Burkholderia cepacia]|uniref:hypothetical protein n=1 Tax=Burkholderia cepacia TaxID=292 RepID=UPI002FE34CD9